MIRIDAIWLATEPMDMRAGTETALARVIAVFGAAKPHCAYLFVNRRATRMRDVVIGQQVVHADETPVQMLAPGSKKTHRSYVWAYATSQFCETAAVVYDFSPSRAGEHARNFLQGWKGKLVCDDFGGYKASFELGVTEIGCMAHARRKFFELHATNKTQLAEQACATSSCCTKSRAKCATWSRIYGSEYGKKKPYR
ncbi:hypothetical protein PS874_04170 [Pseudomonas fluorescens]|nr:hypothetical protein PS874_04170 [Pseudomonas fluorescens]